MKSKAALIILYDSANRILLQHRTDDAERLPGYWGFFGGGIKEGETPGEAVIREAREELNHELENQKLFIERDIRFPDAESRMYLFIAPFDGDKSSLRLNEGQDWGWFKRDEIKDLKMTEHDRKAVASVLDYLDESPEVFHRLDKACEDNDSKTAKHILDSIDSDETKREAFQRIISYYEHAGLFPVGYSLLFIKWLIQKRDLKSAMRNILECRQKGVEEEIVSQIVYEYLIRPAESSYREVFDNNLQLLERNGILFAGLDLDFDLVKRDMPVIADCGGAFPVSLNEQKDKRILMADITNTDLIIDVFERNTVLYLVYKDIRKFYYLLVFEDFSKFRRHLETRKILFFTGNIKSQLEGFFRNELVLPPDYYLSLPPNDEYKTIIDSVILRRFAEAKFFLDDLREYYKEKDYQYYRELFSKSPSDIRIMLITSEETELNKFIVRNWHDAFVELGYQARLLAEGKPYETMNNGTIYKAVYEFRPDIVFHMNYSVDLVFEHEEIRRNLLWIMRYRDISTHTDISRCGNMFVSSMVKEWAEELERLGLSGDRVLYTPDGVNLNIFMKTEAPDERYACDVVSVNNSGGDEFYRFSFILEQYDDIGIKQVIHELYAEINEMAEGEEFIFFDGSFRRIFDVKMFERGILLYEKEKDIIIRFFTLMMFAFYRRKVVEWIIDSGITKNIRVWGRGWSNHEKFRKYHMGIARHGKELSEIYGSSRISISDHPNIPLHERTFEILASGGFPLVKYVRPENGENIDYISNYFRENEEIVLFYSKDDLLNKVQYYLDNPEERERIAENGRRVVLKNFSHTAIAAKTMEFIRRYYAGK